MLRFYPWNDSGRRAGGERLLASSMWLTAVFLLGFTFFPAWLNVHGSCCRGQVWPSVSEPEHHFVSDEHLDESSSSTCLTDSVIWDPMSWELILVSLNGCTSLNIFVSIFQCITVYGLDVRWHEVPLEIPRSSNCHHNQKQDSSSGDWHIVSMFTLLYCSVLTTRLEATCWHWIGSVQVSQSVLTKHKLQIAISTTSQPHIHRELQDKESKRRKSKVERREVHFRRESSEYLPSTYLGKCTSSGTALPSSLAHPTTRLQFCPGAQWSS